MFHCTFCGSTSRDRVLGPDVQICAACVAAGERNRSAGTASRDRCSFCNKPARPSRFAFRRRSIVLTAPDDQTAICSTCIAIARGVLRQQARSVA